MHENHRQLTDHVGEYITGAIKTAPPIAVTASAGAGISLQDWVFIVTIVYTVLQAAYLVYKFLHERAERRAARAAAAGGKGNA